MALPCVGIMVSIGSLPQAASESSVVGGRSVRVGCAGSDLGCFCTGVLGCYPRSEGQRLLPSFRLRLCFSPSSSPCGSEGLAYGAWDVIPADALEPDLSSRPWRRAHMRYSEPTMATTYACHFPSGAVAEMMRWCTVEAQSALKTMAFGHKDP